MKSNPDIWTTLALEGNFDLINKLHRVERKEEGFMSVAVPREGFSQNDQTHNMVMKWLRGRGVNILNPIHEIANLEYALRGKVEEDL